MNTTRFAIASALAAALVLPAAAQAQGNMEKCYGIAKAGKNDCQTAPVRRRRTRSPTPGSRFRRARATRSSAAS